MRIIPVIIVLGILLVACSTPAEQKLKDEGFIEQEADVNAVLSSSASSRSVQSISSMQPASSEAKTPTYADFNQDVLANGETKLLFFHAPWCPFCVKNNQNLLSLYGEGNASLSTYKIDYDTSDDLKRRYGIVTQDTFVLVDGNGTALKTVIHPGDAELSLLLNPT